MLINLFSILSAFVFCDGARILAVFPAPFISHQMVFRPLTEELARRGHEVVVITPDPVYDDKNRPRNLTEVNIHEVSYKLKYKFGEAVTGKKSDVFMQAFTYFKIIADIFEKQIETEEVKAVINDEKGFDLVIVEGCARPALIFSHIFNAPAILVSSLGTFDSFMASAGIPSHPLLYPTLFHQKMYNMTFFEKLEETYKYFLLPYVLMQQQLDEDEMLKRHFGSKVPDLNELKENIAMYFLNVHHIWENSRPIPPNVLYLGGLHLNGVGVRTQEVPDDLKSFLDSSKRGVIYVSFGSNIFPSLLPKQTVQTLLNVLSQVPYDVLLKWDKDVLPQSYENIKIVKWVPQAEMLKHSNIKLFITQGGLQSTDESIIAGVPLIGIPTVGDQWFNAEQYEHYNIGLRVDMDGMTEKALSDAIYKIMGDDSYRKNIIRLRSILHDQPQSALERAVWWTEHVLRHGGARHLRAPAANISWTEYYEIKLVLFLLSVFAMILLFMTFAVYKLFSVTKKFGTKLKVM